MFHFYDTITNTKGDSLVGYFARVIDPATGNLVTMSADDGGTPIVTVSGVADMCKTNERGAASFWVPYGDYHLDIYAPDAATFIVRIVNIDMGEAAGLAGDSSDVAVAAAATATTQAGIATAAAATLNGQAAIATAQASIATTQATIATSQAAIATTAASSPSFKIQTNPATKTTPPAGVSSGDTYWTVDANPATTLTLYLNTAGVGAPTSTTVTMPIGTSLTNLVASLSETFTQTIGRAATGGNIPINGGGAAGAGTYIWADTVTNAGPLATMTFWAKVTGTYGVGVYTKSGTTVTRVSSATFTVAATGLKTATPADFGVINIPAGAYLALNTPASGLAYSTGTTADGSGWWGPLAGGSLPASATVGAATTNQRLEGGFAPSYQQQTVTAVAQDAIAAAAAAATANTITTQTQVTALRTKAVNTVRSYAGKPYKPVAGAGATAGTTFVTTLTVPVTGTINELEIWGTGAGPAKIKLYTKVGSVYTLASTINVTLVGNQYHYLKAVNGDFTAVSATAGQIITFYSASGIVAYVSSAGPGTTGFLQEAGDVGNFTDANTPGGAIVPQIRLSVDSETVFDQQAVSRAGVRLPAQVLMLIGAGQSLQAGQVAGTTTAALYDNIGFPQGATSTTAVDFLPLTAANCANGNESPILETPSGVKDLLLTENQLTYQQMDCQYLAGNVAVGGTTLAQNALGSTIFTNAMSQITAGASIAAKLLKSYLYVATIFKQGESDAGTPTATYKAALKQVVNDYDTSGRAANNSQSFRPLFITYQTNSNSTFTIAQAQHETAMEHPRVRLSTPSYPCVFATGDTQHPNADSTQWMGDFDGLVIKREIHDLQRWWHLHILSASVSGSTITATLNPWGQLVLDTSNFPMQTNAGFGAWDSGGSPVTVSSITLVGEKRVRLNFASSALAASVATIGYGQSAMTGRSDSFVGGGGNLRDNMGDAVVCRGRRMDRWAVVQTFTL